MLDFADVPYKYYPPKSNRLAIWIFQQWNRFFYLPGPRHRIKSVVITNRDILKDLLISGNRRILFLPNHPTHSDPQIMFETQRQLGVKSMFMAAYDVFQRSKFDAWVMQHAGAFSVDRDASDSQAMKQAMQTLNDGLYALTIFSEGNVYLQNDKVTPFLEGAAYIALKAQDKLAGNNPEAAIFVIPVSIKVTHAHDQRSMISNMLAKVAEVSGTKLNPGRDPVYELKRIGLELLKKNLRQRGYLSPKTDPDDLTSSLLHNAVEMIIKKLEEKMELKARPQDELIDRIRKIRRTIHHIRIDPERSADHSVAATWADEAILAFRILSYTGQYVEENPTIDRYGERVEKLMEDVYSKTIKPYGDRHSFVHFSKPMNLTDYLETFKQKARLAVQELTQTCEHAVQEGLDLLNKNNPHPGCQCYVIE